MCVCMYIINYMPITTNTSRKNAAARTIQAAARAFLAKKYTYTQNGPARRLALNMITGAPIPKSRAIQLRSNNGQNQLRSEPCTPLPRPRNPAPHCPEHPEHRLSRSPGARSCLCPRTSATSRPQLTSRLPRSRPPFPSHEPLMRSLGTAALGTALTALANLRRWAPTLGQLQSAKSLT